MHRALCGLIVIVTLVNAKPYTNKDERREQRFTVHEKPPELVVNAGPEGVKVQARPSKLQVIEYPEKRDGGFGGCFGHVSECGGGAGVGGVGGVGSVGVGGGGWGGIAHDEGGYGGHEDGCGYGHFDCGHHEHTTYVPSHSPPVHVGPNAPPIHVGPHVPAVHVGPHVPSIHYGTHAPIYHVGPHVPFVHMPPPVTTVHAGPMGPPVHVSSPPTVYHQPPVVYHQPHVVGHSDDCGAQADTGCYTGHHDDCCGTGGHGGGFGGYGGGHSFGGGYGGGHGFGGYGRSTIEKPAKKEKRNVEGELYTDRNSLTQPYRFKRQSANYGWHPFPSSVHVGPHTPPIHIGPHYPPVHIGPHVPAVHIGPHVPYINIPAHVPAIHVRPHVPAVHISPPVPIINAGNHVPAVHVTSPPTVYHRPPIVIHQPHIVHGHHHLTHGHEIYGGEEAGHEMSGYAHMGGGYAGHETGMVREGGGYVTGHEGGGYVAGHEGGGYVAGHEGGYIGGHEGGFIGGGHDGGYMENHEGGYIGKRDEISNKYYIGDPRSGTLSVKSLYTMIRPRRQILGGGGDGGDSVIFVHPGGSQSPVSSNVRGESPLAGLEPGAGLRNNLAAAPVESPSRTSGTGNAFVKSGLSGLGPLANRIADQENNFAGMGSHGLPSSLGGLSGLPSQLSGLTGGEGAGGLGGSDDVSNSLPDGIGPSMNSEPPQNQHDDGYPSEAPNMNLGSLQGGGYGDDSGHADDSSSMNYQRSLFPMPNYSRFFPNYKHFNTEENLDDSTERDVKSTIPRDEEEADRHERVHKDYIPRPEDFGY